MTEDEIRADERRHWAKVVFVVMLEVKQKAQTDPSFDKAWRTLAVLASRMLENDTPTGADMEAVSKRLKAAGFKIGDDA